MRLPVLRLLRILRLSTILRLPAAVITLVGHVDGYVRCGRFVIAIRVVLHEEVCRECEIVVGD